MIEIEGLSFSHGGVPVLRDISLTLPKVGIISVIGPNGAGKSTLLHCIAGLLAPQAGHVRIGGRDVHAAREAERALMLSLLTQAHGAVPRLSVRELVGFGRWPHHRGRPGKADDAAVDDAMRRFDLGGIATREVEALSGGQKQRAFLAMAYAQTTPWMLLDEPLAALDPKFTHDIMDRLRDVTADPSVERCVLLVLHDLQVAVTHSDWVVCLKAGQVVCAGPGTETLTSEVLTELYDTPLDIQHVNGQPVVLSAKRAG